MRNREMNLELLASLASRRVKENPETFLGWLQEKDAKNMVSFFESWADYEDDAAFVAAVAYKVAAAAESWSEEELNLLYDQLEEDGWNGADILGGFIAYLHYHEDSPLSQWVRWQQAWEVMDACLQGQSLDWVEGYVAGSACYGAPGMNIVGRLIREWFAYMGDEGTSDYFIC